MKLYAKLKFENSNNAEAIEKIEEAANQAIDDGVKYYEHAISDTLLDKNGMLELVFVPGQGLDSEDKEFATTEAQEKFDEKFAEIIRVEFSEVL